MFKPKNYWRNYFGKNGSHWFEIVNINFCHGFYVNELDLTFLNFNLLTQFHKKKYQKEWLE